MRPDMKDVIIDVYRRGGGYGSEPFTRARLKAMHHEDVPLRISNRYVRNSYPADRLAPLEKFLEANSGRPWDDVYSEIRQHCDTRNIRGQHLWEHVISEVVSWHPWRSYGFYVDDNGILRHVHRTKYRRPEPPVKVITIDYQDANPKLAYDAWFELCAQDTFYKRKKGTVPTPPQWYRFERTVEHYNKWEYCWIGNKRNPVRLVPATREIITKRQVGKNTLRKIRKYLIQRAVRKIQAL